VFDWFAVVGWLLILVDQLAKKSIFCHCLTFIYCTLLMDNIIKYMVDDLSTYSSKDINTLARYHNIPTDLQMIARYNLKARRARATMYGKTYDTNQISEVVNMLNSRTKSNICLRTALVVTRYTNTTDIFYNSIPLNIKHQEDDIYKDTPDEKTEDEIPNPDVMIQDIYEAHKNAESRYCFFVIWVTKNGFDINLPVIESHITLTICDKIRGSPDTFVYKYNSGYSNDESEQILDNDIKFFFSLIKGLKFNFVDTATWCPKSIQGTSNMCTVFVFNIYYYCNRYHRV